MRIKFIAVILVVSAIQVFKPATAGDSYYPQGQANNPNYLVDRLNQLETETQVLRAEVQRMRVDSTATPQVAASGTPAIWAANPPATSSAASLMQPQTPPLTMDKIKGEMKKLVWKKGDFTITPYGYLWANMVYETQVSNTGDYALYIYSPTDRDFDDFNVDAKSTRLGFDMTGPRIWGLNCAQSGGKVEFDFQGTFVNENKGSVLLRHAYWEVKDEEFRLLAGQTWDVISPLNPGTVMYSVYWGAGNIGYRRPQFRGERFIAMNDRCLFTAQGSINGSVFLDAAPYPGTAIKDHPGWPTCEGRLAFTLGPRGKGDNPIICGVSGHIGEHRYILPGVVADERLGKTWSVNLDLKAPVNERLGFQGELYTGENLSTFLGGIIQGYNFALDESIYDTGGWMEVYYYWTPRWHSHFGYTVDDPLDRQVPLGGRTYNQAIWGNLIFDVTKQFQVGLEVGQWETVYNDNKLPGDSTRVEFMARYGF